MGLPLGHIISLLTYILCHVVLVKMSLWVKVKDGGREERRKEERPVSKAM